MRRIVPNTAFRIARRDLLRFIEDHQEDLLGIFREEMRKLDDRVEEEKAFVDIHMVPLGRKSCTPCSTPRSVSFGNADCAGLDQGTPGHAPNRHAKGKTGKVPTRQFPRVPCPGSWATFPAGPDRPGSKGLKSLRCP